VQEQLRIIAVLPESSAELTTGRLIRQMAHRGGYFAYGRVPTHLLLPEPIYVVRLAFAAGVRQRRRP